MSIQIDTSNRIVIDGKDTGLVLGQRREGTIVYTPERRGLGWINAVIRRPVGADDQVVMQWSTDVVQKLDEGTIYQEHKMPFSRYSAAHDEPHKPGEVYNPAVCAGRSQLEADVRALLARLNEA